MHHEELIPMMYLSEDPTLLAGGLLLLGGAFLIALRVTQQGKYLIRAGVALGSALTVVLVEYLWVTDNERIEQVVYDLRSAVLSSDVEGVLAQLAPDVVYSQGGGALPPEATRSLIRINLSHSHFDFIQISELETSFGAQGRRGKAEFRVFAKGTLNAGQGTVTEGTARSYWSLGFQETTPGVWKVNRITPLSIPQEAVELPTTSRPLNGSRIGFNGRIGVP
jgi:hypothetical protein